ncbi:ATP-binding cassette sub-family C member 4-like [Rhynchophorus ferrugineus]|uniref:ATP-binding cassette sub-family C member 4-like n=1 Tax=Rhynchophorus ferrugineus TaxID=354439 RepID=UPI003FCC801F
MDYAERDEEIENPRKNANILSVITFFYNLPILKQGRKNDIEEHDLYKVLPDLSAETLGDKFEKQWEADKKKNAKPSLWRCCWKSFGVLYCFYGFLQLIFGVFIIFARPMIISKFVGYFQPEQTSVSLKDVALICAAITGLEILNTLFNNNLSQLMTEYSMKVRTSISSLIYRKALKISPVEFSNISIGKIVTLLAKDVYGIDGGLSFSKDAIIGILHLLVVTYTLYRRVGLSAFPAIGVIFVIIPLQLYLGKKTTLNRIETSKRTDERFRLIQEVLNAIKFIKMYTWENYFEKIISKARLREIQKLKIVFYLKSFIVNFGTTTIYLAFYIILVSYMARGYTIKADIIYFIQQSLFAVKPHIMTSIPLGIGQTADMIGSLRRIQNFLEAKEYKRENTPTSDANPLVYLNQVSVNIGDKSVLKSVSLNLNQGLLLLAGNIGSGKSSILKTVLGEYPVKSGEKKIIGSLSYATEEPWLFPSTIKQNILFGQPYDEQRYQEVLNVCALTYDINQFEKGDSTIVGDKGINLSKGQQARVTLARAVYRDADIYLLDDCLSSSDNRVNKHIFEKCIKGYLSNKICIMVSNNINHIKSVTTSNVLLVENGTTLTLEQQSGALDKRITYYIDEEIELYKRLSRLAETVPNEDESDESDALLTLQKASLEKINLYHEVKQQGGVVWSNYTRYFEFIGGFPVVVFMMIIFSICQFCVSYSDMIISSWVDLEPAITNLTESNLTNTTEYAKAIEQRQDYMTIFTMLTAGIFFFLAIRSISTLTFGLNGAKKLHKAAIKAIINTHMNFFDSHFIGNIINRLSKDFHCIDEYMPFLVLDCFRSFVNAVSVLVLIYTVNSWFFIPAAFLLVKLYFVQRFYLPTGRSLRRLESSTRSPIIGYLNATLEGLAVARASQKEEILQKEFDRHQNLYTSAYYINQTTTKFFGLILDGLAISFVVGILVKITLFRGDLSAGGVGLAITQALMLSGLVQYVIRALTEIESVMTSIERVLEYADVDTERKSGTEVPNWPSNGHIKFSEVSLNYKDEDTAVLKDLNLEIEGRTKIGIVGRTGAGKSSIISTLFRLYKYEGSIFIDDENIDYLPLDFLRSRISIIPQDPVLFSGTLRSNIDPLERYSDQEIWSALEKVHAKSLVADLGQDVTRANYSSGQKQLFCLARALIQGNKIVVLDEATANLDPETDQLVQSTVQECFRHCTVLIIAHRLNSVMHCDKILVLDAGEIVEFGEPKTLLNNKNGFLYKMVQGDSALGVK